VKFLIYPYSGGFRFHCRYRRCGADGCYGQLAADMTTDRQQLDCVRELSSQLVRHGDDVELASLSGRLTARMRRLADDQPRHHITVCTIKFRPAAVQPTSLLGKLTILDVGASYLLSYLLLLVFHHPLTLSL